MIGYKCVRRGIPATGGGYGVVNSGLSVVVRGHLIWVVRDDARRVAVVSVCTVAGYAATGHEYGDVKVAADMLAERARRVLGHGWTVELWEPPEPDDKRAGYRSGGSGV
jgi:hypothetical protein